MAKRGEFPKPWLVCSTSDFAAIFFKWQVEEFGRGGILDADLGLVDILSTDATHFL
jgi:hypothetical protein